jgi:NADH-quinone oxidoreductase subunit N
VSLLESLRPLTLEVVLGAGIALLLVTELLLPERRKALVGYGAALLTSGLFVASFFLDLSGPAFGGAYVGSDWVLFFKRLFLAAATLGALGAIDYLARITPWRQGEYALLLLFSTLGMMLLPGAQDLVFLIVAFELMGIPLYLMAAYGKTEAEERGPSGHSLAAEASLKFYLVGAASTTVLLFGAGLVAGTAGSTALAVIATAQVTPLMMTGAMMVLGGMAFKLGAAPFHNWVPDTYQGASGPFVAFLSVAPKAAGVAAVAAVFVGGLSNEAPRWLPVLTALCVASLAVGNIMAVSQTSARRLLAFSGVAQMGYILLGLATGTREGATMVLFYLAAYVAANLGAFLVVHAVSQSEGGDELSGFEGLARRAPWLSAALLLLLLSLAGIPFVVGFWAKLYIFTAALKAGLVWLVVVGALLAIVALFYYLKVVKAMYMAEPKSERAVTVTPALALGIAATVLVTLGAGLYPAPLLAAADQATRVLFGG